MNASTAIAAGNFCWLDIYTTDAEAAKDFYCALFDWEFKDFTTGSGRCYTIMKKRMRDVCGLHEFSPEEKSQGSTPHWLSYIMVEAASDAVLWAAGLGGKILMAPFDLMDAGKTAVIQDPTGAVFAVWEPKKLQGAAISGEPGSLCWTELATRDPEAARAFYVALFGWQARQSDVGGLKYTEFIHGGQPIAGMLEMTDERSSEPPHWLPYFAVEDCDGGVGKAEQLGAGILVPIMEVPNVGRLSIIRDPQGAVFSIIQLNTPA